MRRNCIHHPDRLTALHRGDGAPLCLSCWLEDRGRIPALAITPGQVHALAAAGALTPAEAYTLTRRAYSVEALRLVRGLVAG